MHNIKRVSACVRVYKYMCVCVCVFKTGNLLIHFILMTGLLKFFS